MMRDHSEQIDLSKPVDNPESAQLNREQRRASKRVVKCLSQQKQARNRAEQSPVGRLMANDTATSEFKNLILTTRIKVFEMDEGADATDMLASLVVIIGTVCEAGAQQFGRDLPWVRQLHGALRAIQSMCLAGYKWQAQYAASMDCAVGVASNEMPGIDPHFSTAAWVAAVGIADIIWAHKFSDGDIA